MEPGRRIADLEGPGSQTADDACGAECGCGSDPKVPSLVCTLDPSAMPARLEEWQALLLHVTRRTPLGGGVRLELATSVPIEDLVHLVRAEHACCGFFEFAITVDGRGVALEVRAPAHAQPVITSLFGPAA